MFIFNPLRIILYLIPYWYVPPSPLQSWSDLKIAFLYINLGVAAEKILPSRFEKQTLYMLDRRRLVQKEQLAAVRFLQCAFREALRRRRWRRDQQTLRMSSRQLAQDEDNQRSMFIVKFSQRRKEFAKCAQRRYIPRGTPLTVTLTWHDMTTMNDIINAIDLN